MGGGIFGAKGNPGSNESLERISTDYFNLAKPLLEQSQGQVGQLLDQGPQKFGDLTNVYQDALQSGASTAYLPSINRATEAGLQSGSQATGRTKEDLVRQGVTGSDYNRQLAQALQTQFFNASQAPAPLYQAQAQAASQYGYGQAGANEGFFRDTLSSFYKALSGAPQVGISGLGTAAGNETTINATNTKAATELVVGLANAASNASKPSPGGCWIALVLYGPDSLEYRYARFWILVAWQGRLATLARRLYLRYGERAASHPWLVTLLKPLFDRAVSKGKAAAWRDMIHGW